MSALGPAVNYQFNVQSCRAHHDVVRRIWFRPYFGEFACSLTIVDMVNRYKYTWDWQTPLWPLPTPMKIHKAQLISMIDGGRSQIRQYLYCCHTCIEFWWRSYNVLISKLAYNIRVENCRTNFSILSSPFHKVSSLLFCYNFAMVVHNKSSSSWYTRIMVLWVPWDNKRQTFDGKLKSLWRYFYTGNENLNVVFTTCRLGASKWILEFHIVPHNLRQVPPKIRKSGRDSIVVFNFNL